MKYIYASLIVGFLWVGLMLGVSSFAFTKPAPDMIVGTWELAADKVTVKIVIDKNNMTVMGESIPYEARQEGNVILLFTKPKKDAKPAGPIPPNEVVFVLEPDGKDKMNILGVGLVPHDKAVLVRK